MRNKYLLIDHVVAGFIVHPDVHPEYETWDDAFDREDSTAAVAGRPHRTVSVPWNPGEQKLGMEVTKVLTCIFGFHEGISDTCWRCGLKGEPADSEKLEVTRRSAGDAYRCPSCTAFWVATWCHRNYDLHRPLLKMGLRSFHRIHPENPYDVFCPWCDAFLKDWSAADFLVEPQATDEEVLEEPF